MRKWCVTLVVLSLVMLPALAVAAVNDTLHDMDQVPTGRGGKGGTLDTGTGGTCSYCHIPHKAAGARLWASTLTTLGTQPWLGNAQKTTPKLCYSCHGTGGDATAGINENIFSSSAHKDNVAILTGYGDIGSLPATYSDPADEVTDDAGGNLECTSCHDVHDASSRPFIKGVNTAGDLSNMCGDCHEVRNNTGSPPLRGVLNTSTGGRGSMHPVGVNIAATPNAGFKTTIYGWFSNAAITDTGSATAPAATWWSRGKYNDSFNMGCNTCHVVHGIDNTAANDPVAPPNDLLAMYGDRKVSNSVFCEGCHTGPDPGLAAPSHPVNTDNASWSLQVNIPAGWDWGVSGGNNYIICESCHDVHYGSEATALWRRDGDEKVNDATHLSTYDAFCNKCHQNSAGSVTVSGLNHHPTAVPLVFTAGTTQNIYADTPATRTLYVSGDNSCINYSASPPTRVSTGASPCDQTYSWFDNTGGDGNYYMTCSNCHFGAGTKAHNGLAAAGKPTIVDAAMCVDCHTFNPGSLGKFVDLRGGHTGSHYIGAIRTATGNYSGTNTGYRRTSAFGATGFTPQYAWDNTNGNIICTSCHYWKSGNVASNNDGTTPARDTEVKLAVNGIIEAAGNGATYSDPDNYLCTGCHGSSPGGGGTHPTMPQAGYDNATGSPVLTTITTQAAITTGGRATIVTSGNKVNCESCHRPHNAATTSGAVILELDNSALTSKQSAKSAANFELVSGSGYLNQQQLCVRCHAR